NNLSPIKLRPQQQKGTIPAYNKNNPLAKMNRVEEAKRDKPSAFIATAALEEEEAEEEELPELEVEEEPEWEEDALPDSEADDSDSELVALEEAPPAPPATSDSELTSDDSAADSELAVDSAADSEEVGSATEEPDSLPVSEAASPAAAAISGANLEEYHGKPVKYSLKEAWSILVIKVV
ncbi:hypothetical protein WICPIJ_005071, partial [Wickerhamomyces pijperi]